MMSSYGQNILREMLLKEAENRKHEYGGVLAKVDLPFWDGMLSHISEEELYVHDGEYGKEEETHCTVLFGIEDERTSIQEVQNLIEDIEPFDIWLTSVSIFDNEYFDVLKFDVESDYLHELHNRLEENLPNEQLYPDYKPHITIAYLKKGEGEKYTKKLDQPIQTTVKTLYYSQTNENKTYFDLTTD